VKREKGREIGTNGREKKKPEQATENYDYDNI
jgi:hypothetical protein